MAIPKITGAQRDFSAGELDVSLKRADENPVMKIGARQMSNWRVLSSGAAQNRPGRRALFREAGRVEEVLMSPGNKFFLVFGSGYLRVYNAAGANVFSSTVKGDGSTAIPWTSATVKNVSFAVAAGSQLSIYIAYADGAPNNVPQVLTWDGVSQTSVWTLVNFAETVQAGVQKRTIFNRISPANVTMFPTGTSGNIAIQFSANILVPGHVGTRMTYCGRQILITGVVNPQNGYAVCEELLPNAQALPVLTASGGHANPNQFFNIGDEVAGSVSGAKGIVIAIDPGNSYVWVQLIPAQSGAVTTFYNGTYPTTSGDLVVGPNGAMLIPSNLPIFNEASQPVSVWNDEVMNTFRGYPSSVFFDQNRLGFCNFPAIPSGIAWSAIGLPSDFYVMDLGTTVTPDTAIMELVPGKSQVLYVLPGMESSEFVFCDNAIYYIPITVQNPLEPGSIAFTMLSAQGCSPVQPQPIQQSILYIKAGGVSIGAVQAPGAYYRPYVVDMVSEFHSHLFTASPPIAIAVPVASSQFEETYAYILLANGSMVTGRYAIRQGLLDVGPDGKPKIGWLPWTGNGTVEWIAAQGGDLIFTTNYPVSGGSGFSSGFSSGFGGGGFVSIVEALDNSQYLDAAVFVNKLPTALAAPAGKGPLWWLPNASVTLIDNGTRMMGTYKTDANGNIIPQFNGGENLASAQLVAGQPWTSILEPFVPDAPPGQSAHQRMFKRRVSRMAVYVSSSTGFLMARLFSGPITPTSPAIGTVMNSYRVTAWNVGDNVEAAPPLREEAYRWRPLGRAYDPRVAVIKDTPGPLLIHEFGLEASI